jgi:hypothetical protein
MERIIGKKTQIESTMFGYDIERREPNKLNNFCHGLRSGSDNKKLKTLFYFV